MSEPLPQEDYHKGQLFRDIDKSYTEKRFKFEQERSFRELHDRVREIVRVGNSKTDDSVETKRAGHVDQDTIHVTAADVEYGDAISPAQTDFLYYITDQNGVNRYAQTLAEHEENIATYGL